MGTLESRIEEEVLTKQQKIAENAKNMPDISFCALAHHIDVKWLYQAYQLTRKDGAAGIDDCTAEEYKINLADNLHSLLERVKSGTYYAPAVKRVYIPKAGSQEKRPIGIPTFEDKILQRAVTMVLEPIYEQEFYDFSYGFRRGRSTHDALGTLWKAIMEPEKCWIIDLDIRKFFDTLDHSKLREILRKRVCDGVITRLIGKWLNAGIMEDGKVAYNKLGTPQGGVVSPMLSNIYLHEVLDKWFVEDVKTHLKGKAFLIRFADDAVLGFSDENDAERVMKVLPKRFDKYGLTIHPEKTRLINFSKPKGGNGQKPGTFSFLGFKHYWKLSRNKNWVVARKTDGKRISRALKAIAQAVRKNRHETIAEQSKTIGQKLRGHYNYYGITSNYRSLQIFYLKVKRIWFKWLNRRGGKNHMIWETFRQILNRYPLPQPTVVHSIYR